MGSYGIGIDRCIGTIVEQNHDDRGIVWPISIAPYKVAIIIANVNDKDAYKYAINLSEKLEELGIDTLVDDRKDSIGVKFADIDLIGIPIRVTVGNSFADGKVELKLRDNDTLNFININEVVNEIQSIINSKQ
jgi:prolyl-tRNA synthetase